MFFRKLKKLEQELELTKRKLENEKDMNKIYFTQLKQQAKKIDQYESKIKDLENNVEFLFKNLTPKKKELVLPELKTNSNA